MAYLLLFIDLGYCLFLFPLSEIVMEEDYIERSFMCGFNDSRDTRSKYNGDPLFLHNWDHSGVTLASSVVTENNYLAWSLSIKITLGAKVKLGSINSKCVCPSKDSPNYELGFASIVW